jgi:carboxypeptidase Q
MLRFVLIFSLALVFSACNRPDPDDQVGTEYTYFSVNQMRTAAKLRQDALSGSGAYALLESLTTEVGGRLEGSADDPKAVAWAMEAFKAAGLANVRSEPFPIHGWARVSASVSVTSPVALDLTVTSLGKSISTPEGGVSGTLVPFKTYQDLVAADPAQVAGKIVFISNKMERAQDGSGYGPAVIARAKGHAEVAKKGGLALIIRSIGTDDSDFPHTGAMQLAEGEPTVPAAALSNQAADKLQALLDQGKPVRVHVDIQNRDLGTVTTANVIGEIPGSVRPDEVVLVGAHLDSWDLATGAMDDGMGIATTLAAARLIAALPKHPARTIRLIAFGAEETGLHGGNAYAAAHAAEIPNIVFGMESDFGIGKTWVLRPHVDESAVPVLREMWRLIGPMGVGWDPEDYEEVGPDLTPLVAAGMPGALLYGDGTNYFDIHHTGNDVLGNLKAEDLDFDAAAYAALLYMAAEYPGRFKAPAETE